VNVRDLEGKTPLDIAEESQNQEFLNNVKKYAKNK
jgi:hypothetical protein